MKQKINNITQLRAFGISMVFMLVMVFGLLPSTCGTAFADTHSHDGYSEWTSNSSLPSSAGKYYLTKDVTINGTWTVPSGTTSLCLNGHTIKKSGGSAIAISIEGGATLNLYDENNTGKITGGYSASTGRNHGGGVFVKKGTFNMYGGTITGNYTSDHGGGVAVGMNNDSDRSSAYFHMYGGVIDNNNSKWGGGLSVYGKAYIHEGTISNNKATDGGGGIELESGGKLYLEGGKVTGNRVTKQNGGLWKAGGIHVPSGSYCYIKGSPEVRNNYSGSSGTTQNNVFLRKGMTLTVNGNLTTSEHIGISTEVAPTQSTPVTITKNLKSYNGSIAKFSSDKTSYSVLWTSNRNEACLGFPSAVKDYQIQFFEDMAGTRVIKTEVEQEGTELSSITKPSDPSRTGYYFAGWTQVKAQDADKGYTYKQATPGDSTCVLVDWNQGTVTGDMSLYPLFVKDRLEIHLDLGATDTINGTDPYSFAPYQSPTWFTDKQDYYSQNAPKNTPATMAKEQNRQFTVNIDEKIQMLYVDPSGMIDPDKGMIKATRAGYKLAGWRTLKGVLWNGESWSDAKTEDKWWPMTPEYADNSKPVKHTSRPYNYHTVTLTAQWVPKDVDVEYNLGDHPKSGSQVPSSATTKLGNTIVFPAAPDSDDTHIFTGWSITSSGTLHSPGESYTFDDWSLVGDNEKITVTAQYREKKHYSIAFDTNGGTAIAPITGSENDTITDLISSDEYAAIQDGTATSREGYDFVEWHDQGGNKVVDWPTKMDANRTYTAQWKIKQYTISFEMDGATSGDISPIKQDYGTAITKPDNPERTHYNFKGWSPEIPATMPAHNMTVEAMWEPISYSVTFKSDDSTIISTASGSYGSLVTLPDIPTMDNRTFTGWKYEGAGGAEVVNPLYMPDNNPTIVAQWKPDPGTENETGENKKDGKITGVNDLMQYSADGGATWINVPNGETEIQNLSTGDYLVRYITNGDYQSDEIVFVTVGIESATITFDTNGGSEMEPLSAPVGAALIRPENPTKPEYSFIGWDPEFPERMPQQGLTLTAKWKEFAKITKAPTASDLTYSGAEQELVTGGTAEHGTLYYRVNGGKWSTDVPKGMEAGKYDVSWYLKPDDGYESSSSAAEPAGAVTVTIKKKEVTLTWDETDTWDYDGSDHVPGVTVSTGIVGETLTAIVTGAATVPGNHTAKVIGLNGSTADNYKLPENTAKVFVINKAEFTPTVNIASWTYGDKAGTPSVEGNASGGNVIYYYKLKDAEDTAYSNEEPVTAGEYTVKAVIAATANYKESSTTKNFTISKRTANLKWSDLAFRYDGEKHMPKAEVSNLVNGDKCEVIVTGEKTAASDTPYEAKATELSNSNYKLPETVTQQFTISKGTLRPVVTIAGWIYGEKANQPKVEGNTGGGEVSYTYAVKGTETYGTYDEIVKGNAGEYTVKASIKKTEGYEAAETTADFSIAKKTASLEWKDTSLTYNGEEQGPTAIVANLEGEDKCDVTVDGKQKKAGEYIATAVKLSNDNYRLPETVTQTFIISKAEVSLKVSMDNWTYGEAARNAVVSGQPEGTAPKVEYKVSDAKDSTYTETKPTQAGKYIVRATLAAADNYRAAEAKDNFEIAQKEAELKWAPEDGKFTYDGTDKCPTATVANLVGGDSCKVIVDGAATEVGEHTAAAVKLTNDNYRLPKAPITKYTIAKKDIPDTDVTLTIADWIYGDDANDPVVTGSTDGANVTFKYKKEEAQDTEYKATRPSRAGKYVVQATIAATTSANEKILTKNFTIAQREAQLKWSDLTFRYDGEKHMPKAEVSNLVNGDKCEVIVTGEKTAASDTPYEAKATELSNSNYKLPETVTQQFTISKGTLRPAVTIAGWIYGEKANQPKVEGNTGGGEVSYTYAVKGTETYGTYDEIVKGNAGEYTVKASIKKTEGYEAAETTADFTIRKKVASLAWKDIHLIYNGKDQCPTATVANLVGKDTCEVTVEGKAKDAGEYVATATKLSNDNYKLLPDIVTQAFIIKKADVELKVSMDDWTYGGTAKDAVVTGQPEGATPKVEYKVHDAKDSTYTEEKPTQAGKYKVRATLEATDNYNAAVAKDNFEIAPRIAELKWAPEDGKFIYDGTDKCPTATVTNLVAGDKCMVIVTGAATEVGKHTAGAITLTNSNYALAKDKAPIKEFEILAAKPNLAVTIANWQYGSKPSVPVVEGNTGGGNVTLLYTVKGQEDWTDVRPSDAGDYTVKATVAAAAGYEEGVATKDFQITPITAKIAWENVAFVYDGEEHVPSARVINAVKGDRCRVTVDGAATKAGSYIATATALSSTNYVLSDPKPTQNFTIAAGTLTPAVTIAGWTYGDEPNTPSVEGIPEGVTPEITYTYAKAGSEDFVKEVPTDAGTYIVKAAIAEIPGEYAAAEVTNEFVISPKTASLAWRDISVTYDGTDKIPTATVDNLVGEDECEVIVEGGGKDAGEHVAKATGLSNPNYKLPDTVNQTFVIGDAAITYTSKGYSAIRDDKYHGIKVTVTDPDGAVIMYGTKKGTYDLDKSPEYKKEGTYEVYYRITADNYETVEGKETVLIIPESEADTSGPDVLTDTSGGKFKRLKARSEVQTVHSITVKWNKIAGATKYVVYGNKCNTTGHKYYLKKIGVSKSNTLKVKQLNGEKLQKGRMHKFMVIAMDEDNKIIEKSATIHVTTKGTKWKNYTGVKLVNPKNGKCTVKVGKTKKIKAKTKGKNVRDHVNGLRYESTKKSVATVTSKGVIKAKAPGKCDILVFTQNGNYKTIKVTVK